jgi:ribonuclease-3
MKKQINYEFINYLIKMFLPDLQKTHVRINMNYFREAMIHVSMGMNKTYERLEYLGDAIFHLIITEYCFQRFEDQNEGFLTKLRIRIEKSESMAELSRQLHLDEYVQINQIFLHERILEDIFESFIGAFYLSFGFVHTKKFIIKIIEKFKDIGDLIYYDDNYKNILLHYFHQMGWGHPIYEDYEMDDGRCKSIVWIPGDKKSGKGEKRGIGISDFKGKAEQNASKAALKLLKVIVDGEIDLDWINKIEKEEKEKDINEKKKNLSVYNPRNKLIDEDVVKEILQEYHIQIDKISKMSLFREAMTHRSYLKRKKLKDKKPSGTVELQKKSNERLQFLGDSVIHFIIGEFLFFQYPNEGEGFLTRLRCKLENRDILFYLSKKSGISSYLLISQTIEVFHQRKNVNIIGGGFKSFIGALYLTIGLNKTREFIINMIKNELDIEDIIKTETNYKEMVLQLYNSKHWDKPIYDILREEGPDHSKTFIMGLYLSGQLVGIGKSTSKKKAEQLASKQMYTNYMKKRNVKILHFP